MCNLFKLRKIITKYKQTQIECKYLTITFSYPNIFVYTIRFVPYRVSCPKEIYQLHNDTSPRPLQTKF